MLLPNLSTKLFYVSSSHKNRRTLEANYYGSNVGANWLSYSRRGLHSEALRGEL
jgi:hypothetical protein